jgi:vancomycin permeability regulator SanA
LIVGCSIGMAGLLLACILIYENHAINTNQINSWPTTIVVFGAHATDAGPSRELEHRLQHAIHLWEQSRSQTIAVSGGYSHKIDETSIMSAYLKQAGVDGDFITELRPGHSTQMTVRSMAKSTITANPCHHWLAVSSGYHALRIRLWGWGYALHLQVSTPQGQKLGSPYRWRQRLREMAAVLASSLSILMIRTTVKRH